MAKSRYPDAVDIRELVTAEHVAKRGGVSEELARAIVDAHIFGSVAVAASGATVVFISGAIFGPYDCSVGRYLSADCGPVLDTPQLGFSS